MARRLQRSSHSGSCWVLSTRPRTFQTRAVAAASARSHSAAAVCHRRAEWHQRWVRVMWSSRHHGPEWLVGGSC